MTDEELKDASDFGLHQRANVSAVIESLITEIYRLQDAESAAVEMCVGIVERRERPPERPMSRGERKTRQGIVFAIRSAYYEMTKARKGVEHGGEDNRGNAATGRGGATRLDGNRKDAAREA